MTNYTKINAQTPNICAHAKMQVNMLSLRFHTSKQVNVAYPKTLRMTDEIAQSMQILKIEFHKTSG